MLAAGKLLSQNEKPGAGPGHCGEAACCPQRHPDKVLKLFEQIISQSIQVGPGQPGGSKPVLFSASTSASLRSLKISHSGQNV